jgi:hypothetical protein
MKKALPVIIGILAAFALGLFLGLTRGCKGLGQDYWIERAKYEADLKAANDAKAPMEAENKRLKAENGQLHGTILEQAGTINALKGTADTAHHAAATAAQETARLKANVQAAIDANPGLQALVANYEFRLVEKDKELAAKDKIIFNLGIPVETGQLDEDGRKVILYPEGSVTFNLDKERKNEKAGAKAWETRCLRAEGLLDSCNSLRIKAEKAASTNGIIAKIEAGLIAAPFIYLGGKALGHALKIF